MLKNKPLPLLRLVSCHFCICFNYNCHQQQKANKFFHLKSGGCTELVARCRCVGECGYVVCIVYFDPTNIECSHFISSLPPHHLATGSDQNDHNNDVLSLTCELFLLLFRLVCVRSQRLQPCQHDKNMSMCVATQTT